jgi:hypothetical protein
MLSNRFRRLEPMRSSEIDAVEPPKSGQLEEAFALSGTRFAISIILSAIFIQYSGVAVFALYAYLRFLSFCRPTR